MINALQLANQNPSALPKPKTADGWNSTHAIFRRLVDEVQPRTYCEVGSWQGASALNVAYLTSSVCDLYCVDTWLGGFDHHLSEKPRDAMPRCNGYSTLYYQFLANVAASPFGERIYPIPATSIDGARILKHNGIKPDLIYIDGSHEYPDVYLDIFAYSGILRKGGVIFGDDFRAFHGVFGSVMRFVSECNLWSKLEEVDGNFWVLRI